MTDSTGWNVDTLKELMEAELRATRDALAAVVHSQQLQNRAQSEYPAHTRNRRYRLPRVKVPRSGRMVERGLNG